MIETGAILTKRPCWNCGVEIDDLYFCSRCASLQRLPEKIDYFTCFGLDRRLNIDLKLLEARFYELSRKFHPDFYQRKSREEKAISLENAALLNKAYRALRSPLTRLEYLIGLVEGENAIATEAPSDLFDEVFGLQETLEEMKACADAKRRASLISTLEAAQEKFQRRQDQELKHLETLFGEWDRWVETQSGGHFERTDAPQQCLKGMKKVLSHRAYLERVLNDIRVAVDEGDEKRK